MILYISRFSNTCYKKKNAFGSNLRRRQIHNKRTILIFRKVLSLTVNKTISKNLTRKCKNLIIFGIVRYHSERTLIIISENLWRSDWHEKIGVSMWNDSGTEWNGMIAICYRGIILSPFIFATEIVTSIYLLYTFINAYNFHLSLSWKLHPKNVLSRDNQ